jgi:hypothetical protein
LVFLFFQGGIFMRIKTAKTGSVLLAAIAVLVLAGCPQEVVEDPSGDASLNSITIKGVTEVTVPAPEGTDRAIWLPDDFQASSMDVAEAVFPASEFDGDGEIKNALVTVDLAGPGADVYFLKVSGVLLPAVDEQDWTQEASFTFKDKDSLYIQVTSADKRAQNYYRVRINKKSAEAGLLALTLGGKSVGLVNSLGTDTIADIVMADATFYFGQENVNAPVEIFKKDALAGVQYGVVKAADTGEPQWSNTGNLTFDEGDRLYIKVSPSDETAAPKYYGVLLHTTLRISSVNIGGTSLAITASGASDLADVTPVNVARITETISQVLATDARSLAVVEYDLLATDGTPVFKPLGETTTLTYTDGSVLYLKVGAEGLTPQYQKFIIAVKSNNRTITGITIGGTAVTSVGTGATGVSVGTTAGLRGAATISSAAAASGNTVAVIFADPGARVTGFTVRAATSNPTAANYNDTMSAPATTFDLTANITNGQHLSIRVEAENGTIWYHRIVVTVTP